MASNELNIFNEHIISLHNITLLHQFMQNNVKSMDISSLLRAEYVLIVSAFDNYLHSIVRRIVVESFYTGKGLPRKLNLPITSLQMLHFETDDRAKREILDAVLRDILGKDSYQSPKSLEYAMQLIDIRNIWVSVAPCMENMPDNIKKQLGIIVNRRNQIAHEADYDCSTGCPRNINEQTVLECRSFLQQLVSAIDSKITQL